MNEEAVIVQFVGGSRDGELIRTKDVPDFMEVESCEGWVEVYERQNQDPPFIYVQIGYTKKEQWK